MLDSVALRDQQTHWVGPDWVSDRFGEFGERRGDPHCRAGVDAEFLVAAT
jgi:hypothetical protein